MADVDRHVGVNNELRPTGAKHPCDRARDEFGILIADDHRSYMEALSIAFGRRREGDHVWGAETREELEDTVDHAKVVVLDWQFGDTDGLQVAEALAVREPRPHVIMVSGHYSPAFERMALHAGACAALPKSASIDEIDAAIDRCRDDGDHFHDTTPVADRPDALSRRQVEVLWLLSVGCDTAEVASRLYLSVATVRTYIRDACRRLGAHSQLEAVAKARRAGLIPSESAPPPVPRS
jgi:DNA-binding NarL/FixJ family response regulator